MIADNYDNNDNDEDNNNINKKVSNLINLKNGVPGKSSNRVTNLSKVSPNPSWPFEPWPQLQTSVSQQIGLDSCRKTGENCPREQFYIFEHQIHANCKQTEAEVISQIKSGKCEKHHLEGIQMSLLGETHSYDESVFLFLLDSLKWIWRRLQSGSEHSARNKGDDGGDDDDDDDDVDV